jgi:hypothetical protein
VDERTLAHCQTFAEGLDLQVLCKSTALWDVHYFFATFPKVGSQIGMHGSGQVGSACVCVLPTSCYHSHLLLQQGQLQHQGAI